MRWLIGIILIGAVFIAGALYGIEQNNDKLDEQRPSAVTADVKLQEPPKAQEKEDEPKTAECRCTPPEIEETIPWISQFALGIGEGVALIFNGVIVVLAGIIQAGS
ncbi:hypothetical protein [Halobacillus litoralis]|uniref:hypothetical protein n=1 Tax=Halobacillus litoralis TaxID=45668 RepID=UPI001CFCF748|nr:hypothetical protein [Halobacillus litoralis]